jgi:uncharacterized phiE125 gp8 family phage protein
MNSIVISQPPVEPVSLQDVYSFLRLDPEGSPASHPDDSMLESFITTAREEAEKLTRRAFVTQQLLQVGFDFPADRRVRLLRPPIQAVLSVAYYDAANALQTVNEANYFVTDEEPPCLQFVDTFALPQTYACRDALRIEVTAGYAPAGEGEDTDHLANIPKSIKTAILLGVQLLYDKLTPKEREDIERARNALLFPHKVVLAL